MRRRVTTGGAREAVSQPVVLLVEDEPLLRSTTSEYLRLSGYVVVEATDAAEAIGVIDRGEGLDVVFSDVSLPGAVDGLGLARWLRHRQPDLQVVLTSGYGEAVRRAAIELVGGDHFVPKPYHQEELAHRIDALLGTDRVATD